MKKLWNFSWFRTLVGFLLVAALLAPILLPAAQLQRQEPENPIREENIQPVEILSFGETEGGTRAAAPLTFTQNAETGGGQTEQDDEQPPEEDAEDTLPELPAETDPLPEPVNDPQQPDEQPGEASADVPDDAGEQTQETQAPDLSLVLSWYRYGSERIRSLCPADESVRQPVRAAQLPDGYLRYELELHGLDTADSEITDVQLSENGGAFSPAGLRDSIFMETGPRGEDGSYTLRAEAVCTRTLEDGSREEQTVTFSFLLTYSDTLDLEAQLRWTLADGTAASLRCQPEGSAVRAIKSSELPDHLLAYSFELDGESASDAKIRSIVYRADNGAGGTMDESGTLILQSADSGENTYTITLTAEITRGGKTRSVPFTFLLRWQQAMDIGLELVWMKNSTEPRSVHCAANGRASDEIRRTELKLGQFNYQLKLTGADAAQAQVTSATFTPDGGAAQTLNVPNGSAAMQLPDGATSIKYTLTAQARLQNADGSLRYLTFTYTLRYSGDVSLELQYTLADGTSQTVRCANGQTRTAQAIKRDQLEHDTLPYTLSFTGGDADSGVQLGSVSLFRSGDSRSLTLPAETSGSAELAVNRDGSTGENTFTVTAQAASGEQYKFTVNIPYMPVGGEVQIETNLTDGQKVMNGTKIMLVVTAWCDNEETGATAYMTASDTVVTLDGEVLRCDRGSSGDGVLQYSFTPKNPETGDENTHTLRIVCSDTYGNHGEKELTLLGERSQKGEKKGTASIYIDMSILGLGVVGPISYTALSEEPASYSVAKAVWGYDAGDPFGMADSTFGWPTSSCSYTGSFENQFYLAKLGNGSDMTAGATMLSGSWSDYGATEEENLARIDSIFGENSAYAALWRSIRRANIELNPYHRDTLGQFDFTRGSGWMYAVGGGTYYPTESLSGYELQDGDVLTLRFTLAYGRDIGGASSFCVSALNGSMSVNHQWQTDETANVTSCRSCGKIKACDHPEDQLEFRETEDGLSCYTFCKKCSKATTEAEAHSWTLEPVEGDDEAHKKVCGRCKKEESEAHRFVFVENTATCKAAGEIVYKCNCGYEKREPSEQLEHELETLYDAAQHWKVCKVCKEEIEGSRGEHSYHWSSVWNDWTCDCGAMHSEVCRGHMTALTDRCTCSREVLQCSKCGTEFERKERGAFSSYPHHYDENGVCTDCGAQNPEIPETPDKPDPDQPNPDNPDNPNPDTPDSGNPDPDNPNPDTPEPDNPDPGQDAGSETEDTQEDA